MNAEAKATSPGTTLILPRPTCAPFLLNANAAEKKLYWDRSHYTSPEAQIRALALSSTVYVGNLAFSTRSIHLRRCFEQIGPVANIHMGLHRKERTPCGFAFVEFHHRIDALSAVANLTGTKLDGRVIRVELDAGYKPGREFGRGASGGQVRDDRRMGMGRDRHSGEHQPRTPQTQNNPRWEPPSQSNASHGGVDGEEDGGRIQAGEKRSRDESMDQSYGAMSNKNPRWVPRQSL